MYTDLVCVLPVIIARGMQRHVCIGNVMSDVGTKLDNARYIFRLESFDEIEVRSVYLPWDDTLCHQLSFTKFFFSLTPLIRYGINVSIYIEIYIGSRTFDRVDIASFVSIYSFFCDFLDMRFIK